MRYKINIYEWWNNMSSASNLHPVTDYGYLLEADIDPENIPSHSYYDLYEGEKLVAKDGETVVIDATFNDHLLLHVEGYDVQFKLSSKEANTYLESI